MECKWGMTKERERWILFYYIFVLLFFQLSRSAKSGTGVDFDGDRNYCGSLWIPHVGDLLYRVAGA